MMDELSMMKTGKLEFVKFFSGLSVPSISLFPMIALSSSVLFFSFRHLYISSSNILGKDKSNSNIIGHEIK